MTRCAVIALAASGCFYTEAINQRPSIDIRQLSSAEVYRGETVQLQAVASDPQNELVYFQWRAYLCTDATHPITSCDGAPFYTEILPDAHFMVPAVRDDGMTPVRSILVDLEGTNALGATAKPVQQLVIPIADHAPTVAVRQDSRHGYVIGIPIDLYAKVGDADDGPANVTVDWVVYPPGAATYTLDDLTVPPDPNDPQHLQYGKTFTPMGLGGWDIAVNGTDPLGVQAAPGTLHIPVVPDHAPCLEQWAPITAPAGQTLPISDPTLFEVLVVQDDLDVYPPQPSDPVLGVTTFAWSLEPPGGTTHQPLAGATGNQVALDPATYRPGDIVELRVEIQDRQQIPVSCADAMATCSVIADQTCLQRLTWRVEIR